MRSRYLMGMALVVFALGAAAGGLWARRPAKRDATSEVSRSEFGTPRIPVVDEAALRAEVRRVLHSELQRAPEATAVAPPAPAASAPDKPATPPTSENLQARVAAHALVDDAKARASWSQEDAHKLHGLIVQMTPEDRQEVMSRLLVGINRDEIKVGFNGPPF